MMGWEDPARARDCRWLGLLKQGTRALSEGSPLAWGKEKGTALSRSRRAVRVGLAGAMSKCARRSVEWHWRRFACDAVVGEAPGGESVLQEDRRVSPGSRYPPRPTVRASPISISMAPNAHSAAHQAQFCGSSQSSTLRDQRQPRPLRSPQAKCVQEGQFPLATTLSISLPENEHAAYALGSTWRDSGTAWQTCLSQRPRRS